eukprot:7385664-Prymnesium_polylepis.1
MKAWSRNGTLVSRDSALQTPRATRLHDWQSIRSVVTQAAALAHDNEVVDEVHKKQREQGSELWVVLGHSPEAVGSRPVSLQYIGCRVSNHATAHAGASDRMIDRMIIHPWRRALLLCRFNDNVQAYLVSSHSGLSTQCTHGSHSQGRARGEWAVALSEPGPTPEGATSDACCSITRLDPYSIRTLLCTGTFIREVGAPMPALGPSSPALVAWVD